MTDTELEGCVNSLTGESMVTTSACSDCMPICVCEDSPQFYNVADCFGDTTSTVCSGQPGDIDPQNIYMPYSVWENDCKDKNKCTLTLSNEDDDDVLSCYNTEFDFENVYYRHLNGKQFDRFGAVVRGEMYETCAYMDLKVLGVCELA